MTRTPGLWAMIAIGIEVTGCAGRAAHATAPAGGALRNRPAPSSGKASARHALARARQYLEGRHTWAEVDDELSHDPLFRTWVDVDPARREAYLAEAGTLAATADDLAAELDRAGTTAPAAALRTDAAQLRADTAYLRTFRPEPVDDDPTRAVDSSVDALQEAMRAAVTAIATRATPAADGVCVDRRLTAVLRLDEYKEEVAAIAVLAEADAAGVDPNAPPADPAELAHAASVATAWRNWVWDELLDVARLELAPVPPLPPTSLALPEITVDHWHEVVETFDAARAACGHLR